MINETMKIIPHKFLHLLSYFHVHKVSILRNQDIQEIGIWLVNQKWLKEEIIKNV